MNYKTIIFFLITLLIAQNNGLITQNNAINKIDDIYNKQINSYISETILDNTINPDNYIS